VTFTADRVLLSGNEAIAHGALEAGVGFATGYPGTPSSEILEALAEITSAPVEWAPNEKVALESAIGASLAGTRALVTMKHVGLNVAADPLFTAAYTGVNAGLVIVTADDPGMYSSQNEQDNRHYAFAAKIPLLEPSDSQEALLFARRAFHLSEQFDIPVLLRTTTRLSHTKCVVTAHPPQSPPPSPGLADDPQKYVMIPAHAHDRHISLLQRIIRLEAISNGDEFNHVQLGDFRLGIITSGVSYQYAKEVAPNASFLKIGMPFPFPVELVRKFAAIVQRLVVFEELDRILELQVRALGLQCDSKPDSMLVGELSPDSAAQVILGAQPQPSPTLSIPSRPPILCAGCPHRNVFFLLNKLNAYVAGDIGCYTLSVLPPLQAMQTCLCMGAGIGQAHGLSQVYAGDRPIVAVIGDSTFVHSGITGLINMAYNQSTATVIILDNRTTAMTGGQSHPATGRNLRGQPAPELDLAALCRALGVNRVTVIDPYDLAQLEATLAQETSANELSVIIARHPCVLLAGKTSGTLEFDPEVCPGCGLCLQLGCPALVQSGDEEGRPDILLATCSACGACVQICPFQALRIT